MSQKLETVFGIHAVTTLLQRNPAAVTELWIQRGRNDPPIQKIIELANEQGLPCLEADKGRLNQQVDGNHQGVVALRQPLANRSERQLDSILDAIDGDALILVLDGVTDPHNLGACLRTADAAGVDLVIAPKDKSAPLNATAAKVACGAAEAVPYIQVTNLARTLKQLQQRGIWIGGTAGEAKANIYQQPMTGPLALVMGAEGAGMRRLTREHCDFLINIPMAGEVSSLNVSVATGVCLFEVIRQRDAAQS